LTSVPFQLWRPSTSRKPGAVQLSLFPNPSQMPFQEIKRPPLLVRIRGLVGGPVSYFRPFAKSEILVQQLHTRKFAPVRLGEQAAAVEFFHHERARTNQRGQVCIIKMAAQTEFENLIFTVG